MFTLSISNVLLIIVPLLAGLTFHECSHAAAAYALGDDTAKRQGRLTLNPLVHLDFIGTLCIVLSGIVGWAKPVPVNPWNFKNPVKGMAIVAIAGPLANFLIAVAVSLLIRAFVQTDLLFRLPAFFSEPLEKMLYIAFFLNIGLCFFNLLPVPPLDGFRVLSVFLPPRATEALHRYAIVFFVALVVFSASGALTGYFRRISGFFYEVLL
ncbi:MAG: site-2 protease family protein [Deltaproteobacteria bacterium]|jgi:Zn-dependent protease|nr:site-2 protease family protein [Deltaproteobacteria bacterium]